MNNITHIYGKKRNKTPEAASCVLATWKNEQHINIIHLGYYALLCVCHVPHDNFSYPISQFVLYFPTFSLSKLCENNATNEML